MELLQNLSMHQPKKCVNKIYSFGYSNIEGEGKFTPCQFGLFYQARNRVNMIYKIKYSQTYCIYILPIPFCLYIYIYKLYVDICMICI